MNQLLKGHIIYEEKNDELIICQPEEGAEVVVNPESVLKNFSDKESTSEKP